MILGFLHLKQLAFAQETPGGRCEAQCQILLATTQSERDEGIGKQWSSHFIFNSCLIG